MTKKTKNQKDKKTTNPKKNQKKNQKHKHKQKKNQKTKNKKKQKTKKNKKKNKKKNTPTLQNHLYLRSMNRKHAMMRSFVVQTLAFGSVIAIRIGDESSHILQSLRQFARTRRKSGAPVVLHAIFVVPSGTFLFHPNVAVVVQHVPIHVPT